MGPDSKVLQGHHHSSRSHKPTWEEGAARSGVWAASSNGPGCVQVVDGVGMRLYGAEHTLVPDLQLQTGVWASCSFGTRGRDLQLVFLILPTPYVHKLGFCTLQAGLLGISLTPLHRTQFVPPNALLIMAFLAPYSSSRQWNFKGFQVQISVYSGGKKVDAGWILYLDVPTGALITVFYKFRKCEKLQNWIQVKDVSKLFHNT